MDLCGQLPRGCHDEGADTCHVAGGHPPVSRDQEAQGFARASPLQFEKKTDSLHSPPAAELGDADDIPAVV